MKKVTTNGFSCEISVNVKNYESNGVLISVSENEDNIDFSLVRYDGIPAKNKSDLKMIGENLFDLFNKIKENHPDFNRVLNSTASQDYLELINNPKELIKNNVVMISIISKGEEVYINQVLNPELSELKQIVDFIHKHY